MDTANIIERIAFLDAMNSQLALVTAELKIIGGLPVLAFMGFGAALFFGIFLANKVPSVCTAIGAFLLSTGVIFLPADTEQITQAARIAAAVQGVPPSEILTKWTGDPEVSTKYISVNKTTGLFYSLSARINGEKSTLEAELARIKFTESGELEQLKKDLLEAAMRAKSSGIANVGQLALIAQSN